MLKRKRKKSMHVVEQCFSQLENFPITLLALKLLPYNIDAKREVTGLTLLCYNLINGFKGT